MLLTVDKKTEKFSEQILINISINESKIIILIRDVPLKENKNERRMFKE